jgi:hypothetical protein
MMPSQSLPDPFEAAVARHLRATTEPVPARLRFAVEQAARTPAPVRTRWTGRLFPFAAVSTIALVAILAIGGGVGLLVGPNGQQPGEVTAPGMTTSLPSPAHSPTPSTLADGAVVEVEPTLTPSPDASAVEPELVTALSEGSDPVYLVAGGRQGAVFIDRAAGIVRRVSLDSGEVADIVTEGDAQKGTDRAIGRPVRLTAAGPDVVIIDDQARPWRWRPSDADGVGTLRRITLRGRDGFEEDHGDVEAYDSTVGSYRLYVVEPSRDQIVRYLQSFDGTEFLEPDDYLASPTSDVAGYRDLYVDFDVYALLPETVRRYTYGNQDSGFVLGTPPTGPTGQAPDYRLIDGSGTSSTLGRLYLYDAANARIVGFSKVDGRYLGTWVARGGEMDDIRGMFVIEGGTNEKVAQRRDDTIVWVTPEGVYRAVLTMPSGEPS